MASGVRGWRLRWNRLWGSLQRQETGTPSQNWYQWPKEHKGAFFKSLTRFIMQVVNAQGATQHSRSAISPGEDWSNPNSQAGVVTIRYIDGREEDYLIFDLQLLAEEAFEKTRDNIVEDS
jgi:hypothetical protein